MPFILGSLDPFLPMFMLFATRHSIYTPLYSLEKSMVKNFHFNTLFFTCTLHLFFFIKRKKKAWVQFFGPAIFLFALPLYFINPLALFY